MKTLLTFCLILVSGFVFTFNAHAAKWRVNNNPAIIADFTDVTAAHDAASPGDTLYIEGSSNAYGGAIYLYKQLVLIGPGYFLADNDSTQHNKSAATIYSLGIMPGAEGSVISGLNIITNNWATWGMYINASNVLVKNCRIYGLGAWSLMVYQASNVIVQQCYIDGAGSNGIYLYSGCQNIIFQNNFIVPTWNYNAVLMEDGSAANFLHNVFYQGHIQLRDGVFSNNIFCVNDHNFTSGNTNITNNISGGTHFGCINGNQCNVDMNNVFVCWNDCTGRTVDDKYMLNPNGVAIGAGYGGVDCGMFDGPAPYSLSGQTNVPSIWELNVSGVNVTVKAKSH